MFKRKKGRPRKNQQLSSGSGLLEDKRLLKRQRKSCENDVKFEEYASKPNLVARMLKAETSKQKKQLLARKRAIENHAADQSASGSAPHIEHSREMAHE